MRNLHAPRAATGLLALLLVPTANAADTNWSTFCLAGGVYNFSTASCWIPGAGEEPPGLADSAVFNRAQVTPYTVNFDGAYTNVAARVVTDSLIWDLQGNTYTLTNLSSSLLVGGFGNTGILSVTNGTVSAPEVRVAVDGGDGTLNINPSGTLSSTTGLVGTSSPLSDGIVNVDGTWNNAGAMTIGTGIGSQGRDQLNVDNGGTVTVGGTTTIGGTGRVTLTDGSITTGGWVRQASSQFTHTGGTLTVDGGVFNSGASNYTLSGVGSPTVQLVNGATSTGTDVTVNNGNLDLQSASSYTQTGFLNVGNTSGATGSMTVAGGSTKTNTTGRVGELAGSTGIVTVTGAGSTWVSSADIRIGSVGDGTLTIADGGSVSNTFASIGYDAASTGSALVTGAGSTWTSSSFLSVGNDSNSNLTIADGGVVVSNVAYIGAGANCSNCTATVTGANSQWNNGGAAMFVAQFGSNAALNILAGGAVTNGTGYIGYGNGSSGTVTVNDGTWTNTSTLYVGLSGNGTLDASNGSTVSNVTGIIGNTANSVGAVTLDASIWTNTSSLVVGDLGNGTLDASNGSAVSNTTGFIGQQSNSVGAVTLDASTWTNTSELTVGDFGNGTLDASNGSTVSNTAGVIANNVSSVGAVTLDASTWTNTSELTVGKLGNGTLDLSNGSAVTSGTSIIGNSTSAVGAVTLDASAWTNTSELTVGLAGSGTLTIQNGGTVSNTEGRLVYGAAPGASGTVVVDGPGSNWTNSGDLILRSSTANSSVVIQNGGEVSAANTRIGDSYTGTTRSASVNVSGTGSLLSTGNLDIAEKSAAFLTVGAGGTVDSGLARLGFGTADGNATVTVGGVDATWNATDSIYVGGSATASVGSGTVNIATGGLVDAANLVKLWTNGTLNLSGGTLRTASLAIDGGALNWSQGTLNFSNNFSLGGASALGTSLNLSNLKTLKVDGQTTIDGGSALSLAGGTLTTGTLVNNGLFQLNSGTLNLTNQAFTVGVTGLMGPVVQLDFGDNINVTTSATVEAGALLSLNNGSFSAGTLTNNGQVTLNGLLSTLGGGTVTNNGLLSGDGRVNAALANTAAGEVRAQAGDNLQFNGAGNSNAGEINNLGGTLEFTQDLVNTGLIAGRGTFIADGGLTNSGNIGFSAGFADVFGDVNNAAGGSIIVSGGATATFYDNVVHNGTEIRVSAGSTAVYFDLVSGAGSFTGTGLNFFEGGYSPGNSPGLAAFEADVGFGSGNSLFIELAGLARGSAYDALDVGGTATLGGLLGVSLLDGFLPSVGDTFDILTATALLGEFSQLSLPEIQGIRWQLAALFDESGSTDVLRLTAMQAVPAPPTVWLLATAIMVALGRARRRAR